MHGAARAQSLVPRHNPPAAACAGPALARAPDTRQNARSGRLKVFPPIPVSRTQETRMKRQFFFFLAMTLLCAVAGMVDAGAVCGDMGELECINSTACKLEQLAPHGKYVCRESLGRCEHGFRQSGEGDIQKLCEANAGCVFQSASCYCPPNLQCACGGGPPAQCRASKAAARD